MSRAPKKIALASLECLKAGASVCPGGVLEDEAEEQKMLGRTVSTAEDGQANANDSPDADPNDAD